MLNRVLVYFKGEECTVNILKFLRVFSEKYECRIDGLYVKDIRKYDIIPAATEGIFVDFSTNYILKEWDEYEKKVSKNVKEIFSKEFPESVFCDEEGMTADIIREKMKGYDLLIMCKSAKIEESLKSIMRTHNKPILLVPDKENYNFEKILFADDNEDASNKSIFKFMSMFQDIKEYKSISVNIEEKSKDFLNYMKVSGKKIEIVEKKGEAAENILIESENMDVLVMGNLKHFFIYERLTGKVGLKLLLKSKIPVFIG